MLRFDQEQVLGQLGRLTSRLRVAFAAACAERQLPNYVRFATATEKGNPDLLARALASVWDDLEGRPVSDREFQQQLDSCTSLLPSDEEKFAVEPAYAEDAVAAVVFAIRTRLTGDSQEALWAARRAYEALGHYVFIRLNDDLTSREVIARIDAHPLVQAELARQQADLAQLHDAAMNSASEDEAIAEVHRRAQADAKVFFDPKFM